MTSNHSASSAASARADVDGRLHLAAGAATVDVAQRHLRAAPALGRGVEAEDDERRRATAAAQTAAPRSSGRRSGRSTVRCEPIQAPINAPAIAAAKPMMAPSGNIAAGQGSGIQACDQAHSAARPTVPIPSPAQRPKRSGRSVETRRAIASTTSASTM